MKARWKEDGEKVGPERLDGRHKGNFELARLYVRL